MLVHFITIWYNFTVLVCCTNENLATLSLAIISTHFSNASKICLKTAMFFLFFCKLVLKLCHAAPPSLNKFECKATPISRHSKIAKCSLWLTYSHFLWNPVYASWCVSNLGLMLWSQFSAIFDNFRRKNWRFSQKPMLWSNFWRNLALFWVKNANFFAEFFGNFFF
jgi:hypothetical protein